MEFIYIFLSALILTGLLCFLILWLFPKLGLMDRPHLYGLTRPAVPYPGGTAIVLSFIILTLIFFPLSKQLIAFLCGGAFLSIINFIDDRKRLPAWMRLLSQIVTACILIVGGIGITHISNPFGGAIPLDGILIPLTLGDTTYTISVLADLFTIFWTVLIINSLNWLDSVPGLTSGIGSIGAFTLFTLSMMLAFSPSTTPAEKQAALEIAKMSLLFSTICFTFNRFDFFPAKMIIGDTGTMFCGYVLAVMAIFSGGKIATTLLVLGFPILDLFWVTIRRILAGQSPFKGDLKHFPHRLLNVGFSEKRTILTIYTLCAIFGFIALMLLTQGPHSKLMAILAMTILMITVATYIIALERKKKEN